MSVEQPDLLFEVFKRVQDIESKLTQLKELNDNHLVNVTIAACLANCKVVEALRKQAERTDEGVN